MQVITVSMVKMGAEEERSAPMTELEQFKSNGDGGSYGSKKCLGCLGIMYMLTLSPY